MSVADPVIDYLDPLLKRIFLKPGIREYHPVTDIYTEIRHLRRTDESLRPYDMPVFAFGNIPKGGGKFTPRYAQFNHGWKVVPEDVSHTLFVNGEQITDDGQSGPAAIDTDILSPGTSVIIQYEPPAAEIVRAEAEIEAIARSSYMGVVVYDEVNGESGTSLGIGTYARPSNNFNDALTIAQIFGLQTIIFSPGTYILPDGLSLDNMILRGVNAANVLLILEPGVSLTNSDIIDVSVTGTLSGTTILRSCYVFDLEYFSGFLFQSQLAGWISIAGPMPASIMSCYGAVNGIEIDLQHAGHSLVLSDFSGDVTFINKTCVCPVKVYMNAGCITLDETVANGEGFHLDGVGHLVNNAGVEIPNNRLVSTVTVADEVLAKAEDTPLPANVRKINNADVLGDGTPDNLWRGDYV